MASTTTQATPRGQEPPMYLQRPSSGRSQDVRHILARTFRDLYTRDAVRPDTVKNLQVSKGGDDPYHERYVENLQKVYTEWQRRMDEAAMLERHIMQAQARAMSADERELNKASSSCDQYSKLGLPPVRAHFKSCIDSRLLHDHNLLTPDDYMVQDPLPVPAPQGPKVPDYARDTLASRQHSCQNSKLQPEAPLAWMPGESMELPTYFSDIDIREETEEPEAKIKTQEFTKRNEWKDYLSEEQREADRKVLDLLQSKNNFLRNPHHVPPSAPPGGRSLIKKFTKKPKQIGIQQEPDPIPPNSVVFLPSPPIVEFKNYKVGDVYEITLELKNMSTVMRQCRVLPPSSNIFSVGLGQFPGESGMVAPGMSCKYDIRFAPDSLKDYDDSIAVQTQATQPIIVPLRARRTPPILTIPSEIDLGSSLVGGVLVTQLVVKNEGGHGRFCLMTRNKWPATSIRTVIPNITKLTIKQPPFEIHPVTFELGHDQSTVLDIIFNPQAEKTYIQEMTIACDNCHASHFKLKGQGEIAEVYLETVEFGLSEPMPGEFLDCSSKNLVRFDDLNPFTYTERSVHVRNCTKTELHYQWMIYKPIMVPCQTDGAEVKHIQKKDEKSVKPAAGHFMTSGPVVTATEEERVPDLDAVFSVSPSTGTLQPLEVAEFKLIFAPPVEGDFDSVVHMLLQHIPPWKETRPNSTEGFHTSVRESSTDEDSQNIFGTGVVPVKDMTGLEIEVKGKCIPLNVVLHPYALFMQTPILKGSTAKRLFTMANHSYSAITFQWEPYTEDYLLEVEPPFGELDPGMAMDLEVSVTGIRTGKIKNTLYCYVMNMTEPLHLYIEAEFKGPQLMIQQPSINFGLVRVGHTENREMTIVNLSEMMVNFTIVDNPAESEDSDTVARNNATLELQETCGHLGPLQNVNVHLSLAPKLAQSVRRIIQVEYDEGESCCIGVYGEAQNPVVCLLECEKFLPEVYLGVPVVFNAVLHNQTLLPTTFKWGKADGSQSEDCRIEIHEESGSILSWEQKSISISFTPLKDMSYSEVRIPCQIDGQAEEVYLNISCEVKTLAVKYKTSTDSNLLTDSLELDFGDNVNLGETVKRYVHICNQTAIIAPYTVTVAKFMAPVPSPPDNTDVSTARSQRRNLLSRTPNIADPLSKTPSKMVQEQNKFILHEKRGAAFLLHPASGQLQPFGEQIIEITAYSDMWGTYQDKLIFKVGSLEDVEIPMTMKVDGCPLTFQMTSGHPEQKPLVRFGSHVSGGNPVNRRLKINNSSPFEIRVDWQVYENAKDCKKVVDFVCCYGRAFPPRDSQGKEIVASSSPPESQNSYLTMDKIMDSPDTSSFGANLMSRLGMLESTLSDLDDRPKFISCFVRPHEGELISKPFVMKPAQMVIPGHGTATADLTFTPSPTALVPEEMDCTGFAEGFLSLDSQEDRCGDVPRSEAYEAKQLRVDFTAHLKPALLTVEETDDEGMKYRSAMSDIMQGNKMLRESLRVCSTMLSNNTLTPLTFRLKVKKPFLLVDLDPSSNAEASSRALETLFCTLKPRHNLMVKVAFKVTESLLHSGYSKLDRTRTGPDRKMEYQDKLAIEFDNGASQEVPLWASLAVPQMQLSTEILDFGVCLVGQTRELEFVLTNHTSSHCHWTIRAEIKSDQCDENTFRVVPTEGMLEAHITHVSNSMQVIKVFFTAKHSEVYDCSLVVKGILGETPRRLYVMGEGSYDGKHEAVLNI